MTSRGLDTQAFAKSLNELLILATLREGARHGYQIALDLESRSAGLFNLQHGTLYPILHRMERDGLIHGRWAAGEGQRRRKEYALTRAGERRLGSGAGEVRTVFDQLIRILGDTGDAALGRGLAPG